MALSFEQLKAEILDRAKRLELCESYQQALIAEDYAALIQSSVSLIEWTYQSGIVDDAMLDYFPETDLNDAGIFVSDAVINNPDRWIYLLRGTFTVNVTDSNRARIRAMAGVVVTLNVLDYAYVDFKAFNSAVSTLTVSQNASVTLEGIHNSVTTVNKTNNAAMNAVVSDQATLSIAAADTAFAKVKAYNQATLITTVNDAAEIMFQTYQKAILNPPL